MVLANQNAIDPGHFQSMDERAPNNIFRFRRLKWADPEKLPVLKEYGKPRRSVDVVMLLLIAVIAVSVAVSGYFVSREIGIELDQFTP